MSSGDESILNAEIFLVAGEPSGDKIGAGLAAALRRGNGKIRLVGLGGPKMKAAGVDLIQDMMPFAVIGFVEVLKHYGQFRKIFQKTILEIKERRPRVIIFIDFPGFNLRLAKALGGLNIPMIYYVSPQFWAWGERRIWIIKKCIRRVLTILPFEVDFYKRHGIQADYVGHPMADDFLRLSQDSPIQMPQGSDDPVISILPGSRLEEVNRHAPVLLESARMLRRRYPKIGFLIPCATDEIYEKIERWVHEDLFIKPVRGQMHRCLLGSSFAWVSSGTATLETAFWGVPLLVVYRTSPLTGWLAKRLIRVPFVGLVNLVAGEEVAPELIQKNFRTDLIVEKTREILENRSRMKMIQEKLAGLRLRLGEPGAGDRAAQKVMETLSS